MNMRRQNDDLNKRIERVMEQGAYKIPVQASIDGGAGSTGNSVGAEISGLMAEIDGSRPLIPSSASPTQGKIPMEKFRSVQEARQVDNQYLNEIEQKLGLLNVMINQNGN